MKLINKNNALQLTVKSLEQTMVRISRFVHQSYKEYNTIKENIINLNDDNIEYMDRQHTHIKVVNTREPIRNDPVENINIHDVHNNNGVIFTITEDVTPTFRPISAHGLYEPHLVEDYPKTCRKVAKISAHGD